MDAIILRNLDQIIIRDNLLMLNDGFTTSNVIPLANIGYLREVCNHDVETATTHPKKVMFVQINSVINIESEPYEQDTPKKEECKSLIYGAHTKITAALAEFHTSSYKINKPKTINIS